MRVIIAGSRGITDYNLVKFAIKRSGFDITEVVSGTARGVDSLGEKWAQEFGKSVKQFPAEWDTYGRGAGYIRNEEMARYADALIAIWDGTSKGTKHMIDEAVKKGLSVFTFKPLAYPDGTKVIHSDLSL